MKRSLVAVALKVLPKEGCLRTLAKKIYGRMYPRLPEISIYQELSEAEIEKLGRAVKIGFVGDLILLRDMVEAGKDVGGYSYKSMFESVEKYFKSSDLMTGVFEGPLPGRDRGYTTANYEDGRTLHCGYPDEFLTDCKSAGINLVTIANNHLFDMGREAMERTAKMIEESGIEYVGYGQHNRKVVEIRGLKIVVLAFTYGFNGKSDNFFFEPGNELLPHLIVPKGNKYYKQCLSQVKADFMWAKAQEPHCILVYPHIGEQFLHSPDKNQLHWFEVFRQLGADVVLGCHPHATQPVRFEDEMLSVYCPGNFVNNYYPYDGDASAMVEVYLDTKSGKPFAAGVIPLFAYGRKDGLINAVPMVEMRDFDMSWHEWFRIKEAQRLVTSTMLGVSIPIDRAQKRYVIATDNVYRRMPYECGLEPAVVENSRFAEMVKASERIAFVGDSITDGTKNGGYGWFEPLMSHFNGVAVTKISEGGITSKIFLDKLGDVVEQTKADLFVVALGCNDIRYRKPICAMDADEYVTYIRKIIEAIKRVNPSARFILVAPWWSDDVRDEYCDLNVAAKHDLYRCYSAELKTLAIDLGETYVDPNPIIWSELRKGLLSRYLLDWIHPNAYEGVRLFSDAFVKSM